ncbi:CHAT domain-containing protein [Boletus edulis BED1]|uniref:CHAT domain-containing protein n=1 Tax=Boletus edulis BED1 TaxID=1328754 RepID=A0AAD4BPB1_BOLED|nr:CHAT domain-containing protein [Boletus edulis BED1]
MHQLTQAPGADPQCTGQEFQGKEETFAHTVITSIRATGITLGLRRLPAGFYTIVHHSGLEWRTENKRSSVKGDVVEWSGPIPIPSDQSATVCLEVYASFEFQPMLGAGEQLRKLTITVEQLSDCGEKHIPFTLFPKDGKIVSPCSSIVVTIERRSDESSDSLVSGPLCSTTNAPNVLEDATNHGHSALSRYRKHGGKRDLERSIAEFERALNTCLPNHPCRAAAQSNLATAKLILCRVEDTSAPFEIPLGLYHNALAARPVGHADRPSTLIQLAAVYLARFKKQGDEFDGARAAASLHEAMELSSTDSHENRAVSFMLQLYAGYRVGPTSGQSSVDSHSSSRLDEDPWILSAVLLKRFERYGDLADLQRAIGLLQNLVRCVAVWEDGYRAGLGSLGVALLLRFRHIGELSDLEGAISTLRDANDLTPHGHPDKPGMLNNLGDSFRARFERLGELSDLEDAISRHKDAVILMPHGHPDKPSHLNNLGLSFIARFARLGELRDLEDAISTLRDAFVLTPHRHPVKLTCLNYLGRSFIARFERIGELSDLEDVISTLRDVVVLTPHGHPDKPSRLNDLGGSFRARFERLGELRDLEDAILTFRDAVVLIPHGHPHKPSGLNNLGLSFRARFERLGELSDLEDAILTLREAVVLMPHGHPHKPSRLNNLGLSFRARFERLGELSDLEDAISLCSHSASVPIGAISDRFGASRNWILCARRMHHPSLLRAYSIAINLFPQFAWIGLSLTHRYAEVKRGAGVVREAAAAALDSGFPELAVEWLEQGHSIVWGELLQLRGSHEQLSSVHPDHARRLRELSAALDDAGATREQSLSTVSESTDDALQQDADRHRKLAIERDKLLQEIRRLPGFERFLLPKDFPQLRASAHSGPAVMLNAAETRCDVLIVLANVDHVIHVPLPGFDFQWAARLQNTLRALLGNARITRFDDRKGKLATAGGGSWESLLSTLWNGIVKPVLDALAFSTLGDLSRIFWCPTGPFVFLPIHAAGLYGTQYSSPSHKVSDFVISSYIPIASIIAQSSCPSIAPCGDLRLLFVPQPPSDGQDHLQGVARELKHISTVVGNSPSARTTLLESSVGTVEEVLGLMKDVDWVHFACHGIQDAAKSTDSGLCLANGRRLKISDIIGLSRSRGGLAFLSAYQTATGDEGLTDEAIHIAAGMLFAGYGGVIGTMWSISDWHAPVVARGVYEYLFRNGTRPDHRDAARALHEAVGRLRESGEASFATWVPFIHVGL